MEEVLPISGGMGDNLLKMSTNVEWWKGWTSSRARRSSIATLHTTSLTSSVEYQRDPPGMVKLGEEVVFFPSHIASNPGTDNVFHYGNASPACGLRQSRE